jgi:hypothetical protein
VNVGVKRPAGHRLRTSSLKGRAETMDLSQLIAAVQSPAGLSEEQRREYLHAAFAASFKALEDRGIFKPVGSLDVYATGPDVPIEALYEEAVPIRDGILAGKPLTRRDIASHLKR